MKRFVEGADRTQVSLLPDCLDDYVGTENPVRVIEAFVDQLDLREMGFESVDPEATGRPAYHPSVMLKIYIYGYLNRVQSSRRLEHETQRNIELMWLTGRLMPDFKTIANFRKDNGKAIRRVCRQFIVLCRELNLFSQALIAIDGSKFKAVNNRDKNFTAAKMKHRMAAIKREHRALSDVDGHSGSGGAGGGSAQEGPVAGQDRCAEAADGAAEGDRGTDECIAGQAGIADRP